MKKSVYLGLSILEISNIVMYEFWYDYVKSWYNEKARLCYRDTDSFIVQVKHVKTKDIYKYITKDNEKRFNTSNYELKRPLTKEKGKNVNERLNEGWIR